MLVIKKSFSHNTLQCVFSTTLRFYYRSVLIKYQICCASYRASYDKNNPLHTISANQQLQCLENAR